MYLFNFYKYCNLGLSQLALSCLERRTTGQSIINVVYTSQKVLRGFKLSSRQQNLVICLCYTIYMLFSPEDILLQVEQMTLGMHSCLLEWNFMQANMYVYESANFTPGHLDILPFSSIEVFSSLDNPK